MPKEKRHRLDKCSTSHPKRSPIKTPNENDEKLKEWEEARCPICMEHPHNAVLLLCSSHNNNCRPYMCDTSRRHSNWFNQYLKSFETPVTTESKPVCPLCRGTVSGWVVVDAAREFMNTKLRTCANETCEFSGTYADLRKHARSVHPRVRPSEADLERQQDWRLTENAREFGDLVRSLRAYEESGRALPFNINGFLTVVMRGMLAEHIPASFLTRVSFQF